jgi:hypothetical protein
MVVTEGDAIGFSTFVADNPIEGLHVNDNGETPPVIDAFNCVDRFGPIVTLMPAFTLGVGLTITATFDVTGQPAAPMAVTV